MLTDFWGPENAGMLWAVTIGLMLGVFAFWIFLQWKIFSKAGYPAPWRSSISL